MGSESHPIRGCFRHILLCCKALQESVNSACWRWGLQGDSPGDTAVDISVLPSPQCSPSSTSAEQLLLWRVQWRLRLKVFCSAVAARANVDTQPFLYVPSTSLSGTAHSGTTCSPAESSSLPQTPMEPPFSHSPFPFSCQAGQQALGRAGLSQLLLNGTLLN